MGPVFKSLAIISVSYGNIVIPEILKHDNIATTDDLNSKVMEYIIHTFLAEWYYFLMAL